MKILFLFPHFSLPGGAADVTKKFARALQGKGHVVEILCADASTDFLTENSDLKISRLRIPKSDSFFYWLLFPYWQIRINRALTKYADYILFPQVLPSNWWAWIFKLTHRKQKIIWYCNEPSAFIHSKKWIDAIQNPLMRIGAKIANPFLKYIDIRLEKQNNFVICNSQFTATEYERCYNRKAGDIIYPPFEIVSEEILQKKDKFFLSVGRISKFKNIDLLINAFEKISKNHPAYTLIIAGDGEEKENLEKLVAKKDIADKITFLGKISDEKKNELYKKARATMLCSENEPFGIVPVESMMHGTPVIAHNSGGPKETIKNNETGFLFKDRNDLVDCMKNMIEMDEDNYLEMQKSAQARTKEFDISKSTAKLEEIFNKI